MLIRLIRTHLKPYKKILYLVLGLQAVQAAANLTLPTLNANLINKGVLHRVVINGASTIRPDRGYIWHAGMIMLIITVVQLGFALCAIYFGSKAAMGFGRDVRHALFHRVTEFSAQEVNTFGPPSLINRITNDVQQVQLLVVMTCTLVLSAPFTAIGGVIMAVRQDVGLSLLLTVSMPVLVVAVGSIIWRMVPLFRLMQAQIDGINRVLREQLTGIRVVRAFVREPEEIARFERANSDLTQTALASGRLMTLLMPTVLLVINGSSVALIWWGGARIAHGQSSIGSLVAFLTYFTLILTAVMMASFVGVMAPRASVCADRIQEVLDTYSSVVPPSDPIVTMPAPGSVEFRDVTFGYPRAELPVLSNINVATAPGQTTAIIGSTGSGKTSLLNLVARLFDVSDGAVLVGDVDVRDLDPAVLWGRIGLVPQKPYLFSGTVRSNLEYGKPDASEDDLWTALEVAQARDFVELMPGGLDASVEQGGTNVSGGQRQRLAIARALVRRPDIYLFDDSFSALDLATDARLRAALEPYTRASAVLIVAQRVSTIQQADQILVLEDGVAVGLGTHDRLLETCPTYIEIVDSQTSTREAA